jgi:hypothetical protein
MFVRAQYTGQPLRGCGNMLRDGFYQIFYTNCDKFRDEFRIYELISVRKVFSILLQQIKKRVDTLTT